MRTAAVVSFVVFLFASTTLLAQKSEKRPEDIRAVQALLNDVGYLKNKPSGIWDDATQFAAFVFRQDSNVKADRNENIDLIPLIALLQKRIEADRSNGAMFVASLDEEWTRPAVAEFTADGKFFVTATEKSLILWDGQTGRQIRVIANRGNMGAGYSAEKIDLHKNSGDLLNAEYDDIKIFNIRQNRMLGVHKLARAAQYPHLGVYVERARFAGSDAVVVITNHPRRLVKLNLSTGTQTTIDSNIDLNWGSRLRVSPDGKRAIVFQDGNLRIWNVDIPGPPKLLENVSPPKPELVEFDASGNKLIVFQESHSAAAGSNAFLIEIDLQSGKNKRRDFSEATTSAILPPDRKRIFWLSDSSESKKLSAFDLDSGQIVLNVDVKKIDRLIASPGGDVVVARDQAETSLRFIDLKTARARPFVGATITTPSGIAVISNNKVAIASGGPFISRLDTTTGSVDQVKIQDPYTEDLPASAYQRKKANNNFFRSLVVDKKGIFRDPILQDGVNGFYLDEPSRLIRDLPLSFSSTWS